MNRAPVALYGKPNHYLGDEQKEVFRLKAGKKIEIPGIYQDDNEKTFSEKQLLEIYGDNWKDQIGINLFPITEEVTKIDLLNFRGLDEDDIEKLIKYNLGIDINTESGINQINSLFVKAISFLDDAGRKVQAKFRTNGNFFNTKQDVIDFCIETTKSKKVVSYSNCIISKAAYIVNDILSNKGFEDLEKKKDFLVQKLKNRPEFFFDNQESNSGYLKIGNKKINFKLIPREKSNFSSMLKIGSKAKYHSSSLIDDGIGFTFFIENKDDSLIFLQYLSGILYEGNVELKNKNFLSREKISELKEGLNPTFLKQLKLLNEKIEDRSFMNYSDLKVTGKVNIPDIEDLWNPDALGNDVGVEVMIKTFDSKSDDGLSFNPIYNMVKYLELQCRIFQGYIGEGEFESVCDIFFMNLDDYIASKNELLPEKLHKTRESFLMELENDLLKMNLITKRNKGRALNEKELKEGLKEYYKTKFLKVKIGKSNRTYYTTKREHHLSLAGYRPDMKLIDEK